MGNVVYKVDVDNKELKPMESVTFSDLNLKERFDIQEWLDKAPEILGEGEDELLIISKELPVNDDHQKGIRLDLLALDFSGRLVVIEIKRDESRGDVDWQAIKYAARCSKYTPEKIVRLRTEYLQNRNKDLRVDVTEKQVVGELIEHIEGTVNNDDELNPEQFRDSLSWKDYGVEVRIILVAREFHPDVAASALWLEENGISISCIKLKPAKDTGTGDIYVVPERIIPLPVRGDYIDHAVSSKNSRSNEASSKGEASGRKIHRNDVPSYSDDEIRRKLRDTLTRSTSLTPRLVQFLEILLENNVQVTRETMKQSFYEKGIGGDIGQAGRYLSNVSQFMTKPGSGHLRQIIEFQAEGDVEPGAVKNSYKLLDKYRELVRDVLKKINQESPGN